MVTATLRTFKNVKAVFDFLTDRGYEITQPTLYRHVRDGKLAAGEDGTFTESAAVGYAETFLKRSLDAVGGDDLQREKVEADTRRALAMAKLAEEKAKRESGRYVLKEDFDRALAQRAMLLKQDLKNFAHADAAELCATVDGDHNLVPDLILLLLRKFEEFLDRYAATGQAWEVQDEG